ncbi:mechanosensitive ion channel family protein [Aureivirga marina]|uniref:mechanosensitive ion channel family protein n=1 Tax=Aureivirga marina TaxID=1182451 RepID=UPI0018C95733|nr:mechanosensitive ion channel family protein [Aureivirga marina]
MKKLVYLLFFLCSTLLFSQEKKTDLSSPRATIYNHLHYLQQENYHPKQAAKSLYLKDTSQAEEKAVKLQKIIEGRGLKVDIQKIPNDGNHKDTIGYNIINSYKLFPTRMPEIFVEKRGKNWYYSEETVNSIDKLYNDVYPWYIASVQKIIPAKFGNKKFLGLEIWQHTIGAILTIFIFVFYFLFKKVVYLLLRKGQLILSKRIRIQANDILKQISRTFVLIMIVMILKKVIPSLQLAFSINSVLFLVLNISETIFWIYIFLKIVKYGMRIYEQITLDSPSKLDDQLVPILNKFLKGIVIFVGGLNLLTVFGISFTTVLGAASIGGLAIAFASQDTVKNLIGTFMIFLDKPFQIGDWIETDSVVGRVEEVGFRSSRIRAVDSAIFQIPNSRLSEMIVRNNKRLKTLRRYQTELGVRYDTPPEMLESFIEGVKEIAEKHGNIKRDLINVEFAGFGDSALLILVNVYFYTTDWGKEQSDKHKLHLGILKLANNMGIEFAFNSTTLMIEQFPEKESILPDYKTSSEVELSKRETIDKELF